MKLLFIARKSKRGRIPLRNDFCHTLNDPFSFMRKTYGGFADDKKASKRKRNGQQKKQPVAQHAQTATQHKRGKRREREVPPQELLPVPEELEHVQESLREIEATDEGEPQPHQDISRVFSWLRGASNVPPESTIQVDDKFESLFACKLF